MLPTAEASRSLWHRYLESGANNGLKIVVTVALWAPRFNESLSQELVSIQLHTQISVAWHVPVKRLRPKSFDPLTSLPRLHFRRQK